MTHQTTQDARRAIEQAQREYQRLVRTGAIPKPHTTPQDGQTARRCGE